MSKRHVCSVISLKLARHRFNHWETTRQPCAYLPHIAWNHTHLNRVIGLSCGFFFQVKSSARIFFQINIASFWTVKSRFITYVFTIYTFFYSHNRSKDTGHFLMQDFFRKCNTVRQEKATWSGQLSCAFFSVPAFWNPSPKAHHNDVILHSPKQPLSSALHSKMSIEKEGTCLIKVKY